MKQGFDLVRFIISVVLSLGLLIFCFIKNKKKESRISTRFIANCGVFAGISIILYIVPFFNVSLPFFPEFLKLHFDEIPVFIAGFAYGPSATILILLVKTLVKLPLSSTLCVGEFVDLIFSASFILPAVFIYRKDRHFKGAIIGLVIGFVSQLVVSSFLNAFVMLDLYMFVYGMSEEVLLGIVQAVNPKVTSLTWPYILFVNLPFNAIKNTIVIALTLVLYKRIKWLIDRIGATKN